ncbi:MAG: N-6 DNA methylase [Candidatus Jorgensenbacteria bacterium]|nr:N-6 DNA methylase [Candidatus Jorgensenbacteria bacterium]
MNKVLPTIQEIQKELNTLAETKSLAQAQRVILSVVRLLDDSVSLDDQKSFQLFNVDNQKISANAQWFFEDNVVVDRRAIYKIHSENNLNIDFKLYGITKPSKRTISWIQALTPNFEDEPFNSKFNIGIDFVVPKSVDRVIIVLSNNYVVRTLELKGTLTATFQEILAKWASISDFSNKKEVHSILWESFDLQPLNKKFYAGISERFITLRQYLTKENILDDKHASLFANRLLGRVIFCWFLDKKGVINPDRKYFDSHSFTDDSEYYRKNLENLFFGVLNTPIADREYKDDVTPFLNGGLFEARDTDLYKNSKLSFPKNYYDDLFDFLTGYNFTTDESTSQFQQVAIDPEMLGRIFENLLAEMTEETGEQARKAKGAFYTPREIVDYMCRESLREYLKTKIPEDQFRDQRFVQLIDAPDKDFQDQDHNWRRDWKPYKDGIIKALDDLKVLDPACGSGAFPIGMLQLLVRVYERLEPRFDTYKAKLQIVEKNIYGVDIDPMAIEISRLRAWLSIIVDEEADSKKIKPLPNLEFKFICANSLIDLDQSGATTFGDDPDLANKLQEIRDGYFNTESVNKKKKLRADYESLVNKGEGLFGESLRSKQLKTYRPFDNEWTADFFNPKFMFGVKSFDVVLGNPPYITLALGKKQSRFSPDYLETLENLFAEIKEYKNNTFVYFIKKAYDLTGKSEGIVSYIVPNVLLFNKNFSKIRKYILDHSNITYILDIKDKVFESAEIGGNCIFVVNKNKINRKSKVLTLLKINDLNQPNYEEVEQKHFFDSADFKFNIETKSFGLISKLEDKSTTLEGLCSFYNGIKTGDNKKFLKTSKEDSIDELVIRGRDIQRYYIDKLSTFVHFDKKELWSNCNEEKLRKSPKILVRQTGDSITASIEEDARLHMDTTHSLFDFKVDMYYLLGLLNSSVIDYWHKTYTSEKGRAFAEVKIANIKKIPIRVPSDDSIADLAKLISVTKSQNNNTDTSELEEKMNDLVMSLYELTENEKNLIKNN